LRPARPIPILSATARAGFLGALATFGAAAQAQEIEPRAYSNIPQGVNFAVVGYANTSGGLLSDPTFPLDDAKLNTDAAVFGFAHAIQLHGQSGKIDLIVPYFWLEGTAEFAGEPVRRRVQGFGDPRLRLSVNLYGAPALALKNFSAYRQDTIVGFSVQVGLPLGQYDETRLVNLGTNRWLIKPELGVSKAVGAWTLEAAAAANIFGDNDDFFGGRRREQEPIYSVQAGVTYGLKRGAWLALNATYYTGGRTTVNGVEGDDLQKNSSIGFTAAIPLSRRNSLKFYAATGLVTRIGTDADVLSLAFQHRWGGGL
jgi:hypothetical protein